VERTGVFSSSDYFDVDRSEFVQQWERVLKPLDEDEMSFEVFS
jgi:hypothetical protein